MARADLILNLIRAATRGDQALVQKTAEALAADERAKNHTIFAERILAQLKHETNGKPRPVTSLPALHRSGPLWAELTPKRRLSDLILPGHVEASVRELVEEQHRADLLRSHGLEPRHRVLFAGPPGNGKTSLAEAIADALCVPFLVVRYEALIGSYLGETAQRVGQVFEHARSRQCVLFFDEFDVVGKERGDVHETGEIKRVVSSLLLQVDALPSYVVVIAASNHPELLDRAVWRRFQLRLELPMPRQGQIEAWFRRFKAQTGHDLGLSPRSLAQSLKGLSFAEVEEFGLDVLRRIVLAGPAADPQAITKACLDHWKKRFSPAVHE
ncbi:ATP-binding protein [Rhodocaloribacter litoris]|uniref:AAA family ATPase n=1 Tax=Rhodocaloribacter litoris TaxID=2558931 RepID=UPI00141FFFA0|nr:ATP-binding protein [Rhodocaloribacter litoris]QXD16755.1 ATP-binding protein [Rhodocaloribacter litoris]